MKRMIALVALTAGFACNMITGADGIRLDDDDDEETGASGVPVTSAGSGGATTGPGSGAATSNTVGAQQATSGVSSTSSGTPCTYPAGPYGVAQGQVVPPTLTWQGYAPGSNTVTTISIQDFFDCDGSKGINAVMVDTSQFG
jgi:hypothetical protein